MTKKVASRNQAVLYGFAFMQAYQAARRVPQEAAYNLARAAHELNLLHVAVPFYEQALQCVTRLIGWDLVVSGNLGRVTAWHQVLEGWGLWTGVDALRTGL